MSPQENQPTVEPSESGSTKVEKPPTRIARYDEYYDLRTLSTTRRKTNKPAKSKLNSRKRPVLVVVRKINNKGHHSGTVIEIKSQVLFELLLNINENVDTLVEGRSPPIVDPKLFFFSHFRLIETLEEENAKQSPDEELVTAIEAALQFIAEDYTHVIQEVQSLTELGQITFELLWALILPNTLIYRRDHVTEQDQVLIARSVDYGYRQDSGRYARIACDIIHDDGSSFGLARQSCEIDEYAGVRKICDLPVHPLVFRADHATIREKAILRARKFAAVQRHMFETHGPALREKMNADFKTKTVKFHTYGRVMIDPGAFAMYESEAGYNPWVHSRLDRDQLTDDQCAIFSPIVLGFCFGTKTWGGFAVDRLSEVQWSDEAFRSLVLGTKQKELIHALIRQHTARSKTFDDVIAGKGRGLIGLLCGRPGCGKTLTAEATAELTHSALYVVSAGELGTAPEEVDQRLSRVLELAQMWGAVLLLDEAEVFLQERRMADLTRNALVSIFLRQLEYYQGILILTTNLIAHIDAAFESRIHFCIHYPDLDKPSRLLIWHTFFQKALKDHGVGLVSEGDFDRLATREMNGRQIKNAVSSAQSLALDEGVPLSVAHVDKVLDVVSDWHAAQVHSQNQAHPQNAEGVKVAESSTSNADESLLLDF